MTYSTLQTLQQGYNYDYSPVGTDEAEAARYEEQLKASGLEDTNDYAADALSGLDDFDVEQFNTITGANGTRASYDRTDS